MQIFIIVIMEQSNSFNLSNVFSCLKLDEDSLLVSGKNILKVISIENGRTFASLGTETVCWKPAMSPDRKSFFVASKKGLLRFSLPLLIPLETICPEINTSVVVVLKKLNRVLLRDFSAPVCVDLATMKSVKLASDHRGWIFDLAATDNEKYFFSVGEDATLKKWSASSWIAIDSAQLDSSGSSVMVWEEKSSVLVGTKKGTVSEFSFNDLKKLRSVELHRDWVRRFLQVSPDLMVSCSFDGCLAFPFTDFAPIKVSTQFVEDLTMIEPNRLACSCSSEGIKIFDLKISELQKVESACQPPADKSASLSDEFLNQSQKKTNSHTRFSESKDSGNEDLLMQSLQSSISTIRSFKSNRLPKYLETVKEHLNLLLDIAEKNRTDSNRHRLSLLPCEVGFQRAHLFGPRPHNIVKEISREYTLERAVNRDGRTSSEAILTLFERKIKLFGKLEPGKSWRESFEIKSLRRGSWVWELPEGQILTEKKLEALGVMKFKNGWVRASISDGEIVAKPDRKGEICVRGETFEIKAVGVGELVMTKNKKVFHLDLKNLIIRF